MWGGVCHVIALSRNAQKLRRTFAAYEGLPNFTMLAQGVEAPLSLEDTTVDYIFHAASPIERTVIERMPLNVISPNVFAAGNLLELLREQKQKKGVSGRMIVFSSATVYGGSCGEDRTVTEADTHFTEPLDFYNAPYSQSKRIAEVLAASYWKQHGVETVIGRFSYVYGYSACHPMTAFFEFLEQARRGDPIRINAAGLPRRDNIYVEDAVDGALCLALAGKPGEAYNISSNGQGGNFAAVDEIARVMVEQAGAGGGVACPEGFKHLPGLLLDNTKLKTLGWELKTDLKTGIAAVFRAMETA